MSTENQNLDQAAKKQVLSPNPAMMGGPSIGSIVADILTKRAAQKQSQDLHSDLVSIAAASGHGKSGIGLQMENLKAQEAEQEQVKIPSFAEFFKAMTGAELEYDGQFRENEQTGEIELIPEDFVNKKISIKIEVSDLMENKQLNSSLDLFLDGKGAVSFHGDSGLESTKNSLERTNVIIFSTVVDAMKEFYNELGGGN